MHGITENWAVVEGYPLYCVSDCGRILSNNLYNRKKPMIMRQCQDKDGHMKVRLSKGGRAENFFVHRLVASAFIPNPNNLPIVNHKDENPANNCVQNLEWCTARENTVYNNMPHRRASKLCRMIVQKSLSGELIGIYESRADIERIHGLHGANITATCRGRRKNAYGYCWEYASTDQISRYKMEWGHMG